MPGNMLTLDLSRNQLTGEIPPNFLSARGSATLPNTLSLNIGQNRLLGTIPPLLFVPVVGKVNRLLSVQLQGNLLSGEIPPDLLQPFASVSFEAFTLRLSLNNLTGSIADTFFPDGLVSASTSTPVSFTFEAFGNQLTGNITSNWFANLVAPKSFTLRLNNNLFSGTLPDTLLPNGFTSNSISHLVIALHNNEISGTLPPAFLTGSWTQNMTFSIFHFQLDNNELEGPIPADLFTKFDVGGTARDIASDRLVGDNDQSEAFSDRSSAIASRSVETAYDTYLKPHFTSVTNISLGENHLEGSIPPELFALVTWTSSAEFTFSITGNSISGQIPDELVPTTRMSAIRLLMGQNKLSGTIPSVCTNATYVFYHVPFNNLSGPIPPNWCGGYISLVLSNNSYISGEIPAALLSNRDLGILNVSGTGISGHLRHPLSNFPSTIDLSYTDIEFCSAPTNSSLVNRTAAVRCWLDGTQACECPQSYPGCSLVNCAAVTPISDPISPPISSPSPTVSPMTPPSSSCPLNTRPSSEFTCVNGTWTAPSITTPRVIVPSGAGSIVVTGNVTSDTITFDGLGSTITIEGCAANLTSITVELTESDLERFGRTKSPLQRLLVFPSEGGANGTNCTDLSHVAVNSITRSSSCKKVKVEKAIVESGQTLGAFFTVDSSGCNRWWIILVSVVAAIVFIGMVVGIIAIVVWNRSKAHRRTKAIAATRG